MYKMINLPTEDLTGVTDTPPRTNLPLQYLTASSIIGDEVYNKNDEHLGDIKDVMIDITTGKIEYYVIEFGGFLGIGEKFFAVPFRVLEVNSGKRLFVLDQPREVLEKAPGFDKDHWPKTNEHSGYYDYWSFI
jgi:sporulation protein YlmC with PRC-barrel domain